MLGSNQVSVADLVGHNVPLQWYEAVAVVQQLCDVLIRGPHPDSHCVPEPAEIFLDASGEVVLGAAGLHTEHSIKRLGLTLNALLEGTGAPTELRLFVSRTTFEVPAYSSIQEFSAGLAYFERPGRIDTLRDVHERAKTVLANRSVDRPVTVGPLERDEPETVKKDRPKGRSRGRALALSTALFVGVTAVAAIPWVRGSGGLSIGERIVASPKAVKTAVVDAFASTLSFSRDLIARSGLFASADSQTSAVPVTPQTDIGVKPKPSLPGAAPERADLPASVPTFTSAVTEAGSVPLGASGATGEASSDNQIVTIRSIRRTLQPDVVRVTLELDNEVPFHEERLSNPARMFVDLKGTKLAASLTDTVLTYDGNVVKQIRIGRHPQNTTRVVLDLQDAPRCRLSALYNPFSLVVDCERPPGTVALSEPRTETPALGVKAPENRPAPPVTPPLASTAASHPLENPTVSSVVLPPARRVYSDSDGDVTRPIMVYPVLPKPPAFDVDPDDSGVIELLIDEAGLVERVQLITSPGSFRDRMILSAAKAWRFKPAEKDGYPVRYRQFIRLAH